MAHSVLQYADALWYALQEEADTEKRGHIYERFETLLAQEGATHLAPAIISRIESHVKRQKEAELRVTTADDNPELVAGAEVQSGDLLIDNTLRSRFARLTQAIHTHL